MLAENSKSDQTAVLRARRRRWSNRAAEFMISIGGGSVIAIVVAIFVFIGYETLPLWSGASVSRQSQLNGAGNKDRVLAIAENEYRTAAVAVREEGLSVFHPASGQILQDIPLTSPGKITSAFIDPSQKFVLRIHSDGRAVISELSIDYEGFSKEFSSAHLEEIISVPLPKAEITAGDFQSNGEDGFSSVLVFSDGDVRIVKVSTVSSLFDGSTYEATTQSLPVPPNTQVKSAAIDQYGDKAVLGTSDGMLLYWDIRNTPAAEPTGSIAVSTGEVTALKFLLGGQTIITGDSKGGVRTFTWALDSTSLTGVGIVPLHSFEDHSGRVNAIATATRNKTFLTGDDRGEVALHYQTTEATVYRAVVGASPIAAVSISPRLDGLLLLTSDGLIVSDSLYSPHPEISPGVLFGKVQYEGYKLGSYTWQSTGGTDDFEPKFSLTPLLYGTVKGAVYALIFALPMAILAALYTSLFAHPRIRNIMKPVVELMAALPSVVIGFIAALWLAPLLEKRIVDVVLILLLLPIGVIAAYGLWQILPRSFSNRLLFGSEILLLIPVLVFTAYVGSLIAPSIESAIFGGSFRQWLFDTLHITYDQRNSLVVGFAMGFAVIPIIFTISEDALSSVPEHLTAGSLALGATRWQTALRVVLPTASPGIFSAAMVGFGRAVGETMIVLMATGNTPVMDLSPFVGMRTLSANIAVEIPEAPYLGSLYRILFLSGLLLFGFTFAVNTVAELVRQRLRKRYSTI